MVDYSVHFGKTKLASNLNIKCNKITNYFLGQRLGGDRVDESTPSYTKTVEVKSVDVQLVLCF